MQETLHASPDKWRARDTAHRHFWCKRSQAIPLEEHEDTSLLLCGHSQFADAPFLICTESQATPLHLHKEPQAIEGYATLVSRKLLREQTLPF
eukprot:1146856-Pelagomonas_calceolata.AAC.11